MFRKPATSLMQSRKTRWQEKSQNTENWKLREEVMARNSSVTLEQLFSQIQEGEIKELNLIIKGDVQGSVEALTQSLEKLKNENVKVRIIHTGVGTVTESDIMLANTSGAIIIAFNVRPSTAISSMADRESVEIRTYRVIYDVIDEVEAAMKGMLDPVFKEVVMGKIEIRNTFKVPGCRNNCRRLRTGRKGSKKCRNQTSQRWHSRSRRQNFITQEIQR